MGRETQFLSQIAPFRVRCLDQVGLPLALPVLDLLLARDRGVHRPGELEPDERFDAIAFGEAVETAVAVLDGALDQVRGDAGVERAVGRAGDYIDAGLEVGVHGVEARAAMDPGSGVTSLYQTGYFPAPRHAGLDPASMRPEAIENLVRRHPSSGFLFNSIAISERESENPFGICLI